MERRRAGHIGGSSVGGCSSKDGAPGDAGGDVVGVGGSGTRGGGGGARNTRGRSVSLSSSSSSSSAELDAGGFSGVLRSSLLREIHVSIWRQCTHGGGVPFPDLRRENNRGTCGMIYCLFFCQIAISRLFKNRVSYL